MKKIIEAQGNNADTPKQNAHGKPSLRTYIETSHFNGSQKTSCYNFFKTQLSDNIPQLSPQKGVITSQMLSIMNISLLLRLSSTFSIVDCEFVTTVDVCPKIQVLILIQVFIHFRIKQSIPLVQKVTSVIKGHI